MATRSDGSESKSSGGGSGGGRSARARRGDKSVEAFRDALERSVTISRERLQEVVDEAVERGRITRSDANEMVSKLVSRGRKYSDELIGDLERMLEQARKEVSTRSAPASRRAKSAAGKAARAARDKADPALAEADKLRRRAGVRTKSPITGYEQLTAAQIKSRLADLGRGELRRVQTIEKHGKARKTILDEIDRRLGENA